MDAITSRWGITENMARKVVAEIWSMRVPPKIKAFLWTLAHQALPTI